MDCTVRAFQKRKAVWDLIGGVAEEPGVQSYAYRQADIWGRFSVQAGDLFRTAKAAYQAAILTAPLQSNNIESADELAGGDDSD